MPGYHLNKRHWITVTLDGEVPDERVKESRRRQLDDLAEGGASGTRQARTGRPRS